KNVSPFDIHVVAATKEPEVHAAAEAVVVDLEANGYDILFDDRPKVSPGVKFGDAELIGVPVIVIVGKGIADGNVELWDRRSNDRTPVPVAEIAGAIAALV
ncbi:MAG: prolyl-tRNA synthetase, partial [Microbacteriaceae bacterium]|nr:prolyl-tRNA synthetase [Microbacteriaceae bacterium]